MIFPIQQNNLEKVDLSPVINCLQAGGVIVHATETVYGFAARWDNMEALIRVANIKDRSKTQPFSIMVANTASIIKIADITSPQVIAFLESIFPGPITVLLERQQEMPTPFWNQFTHLGFRMPDDPLCRLLIEETGFPLITTSANISGEPAPAHSCELYTEVKKQSDFVLDSGACLFKIPSTIIRLDTKQKTYKIIREGAYAQDKLQRIFQQTILKAR